mgnify:FL=1
MSCILPSSSLRTDLLRNFPRVTSQRASGAPRVSAFKHFPKGKILGRTGFACPAFFQSGAPLRRGRKGITQKQLDELHIAIVKPQD